MAIHILMANVISIVSSVKLVCKCGKCHVNYAQHDNLHFSG
jgi:hypothetical protein